MATSTSSRWLPIALAASMVAGALAVVAVGIASAATSTPSSFVPIVPCRLVDTRPDSQVGTRGTPIGANSAVNFAVWGQNGDCTIPGNAVGIASNVTVVGPTAPSYLTLYPADASTRPTASNLNYGAGSPPTPNQVTVALSDTGAIAVYNLAGNVDVIIDVVGYYVPASASTPTTTTVAPPKPLPRLIEGVQSGHAVHGACNACPNYAVTMTIPAGRWLVSYAVTNVNFEGTSDLFRCWFELTSGGGGYALSTGRLGGAFPNVDVMPFSGERALTLTASANVRIACSHDNDIDGGVGLLDMAYMEQGVLTALEVSP